MEIHDLRDFGRRMTAKEVAAFLGVSVMTVYQRYQEFGGIRVGRKYVFFEAVFRDAVKEKVGRKADDVVSLILPGFDDAVQDENGVGRASAYSGPEADASVPDAQGGVSVGTGSEALREVFAGPKPGDAQKLFA